MTSSYAFTGTCGSVLPLGSMISDKLACCRCAACVRIVERVGDDGGGHGCLTYLMATRGVMRSA